MKIETPNESEVEVFSEQKTCEHHKHHPEDRNYPGCTCSGTYRMRRKMARDQGGGE